jgi:aldose 1-epimerase
MVLRSLALAALLIGAATPAMATEARQSSFGRLPDGRSVPAVTLTNKAGVSATVIAYGASLQSLVMPDRTGKRADVVLGYDTIDDYLKTPQYFGSTVGRFARRARLSRAGQ